VAREVVGELLQEAPPLTCNDGLPRARIRHADRTGGLNEEHLPRKHREDECLLSLGDAVVGELCPNTRLSVRVS
jgi:hypothetical protein